MPFTDIAPPPAPPPPGTGITFSLTVSTRGIRKVRITLREEIQNRYFGGPIDGMKFTAQAGRGSDEGRLRLAVNPEGTLTAKGGIKGSASIHMAGWDLLPKDKRPAASCKILESADGFLILELPPFCKPSGVGGRMAEEFALRKTTVK
ncbi:hypothetical protein ACFQFQ_14720 [Sulfitobacter porphyrae]|uniref:Uncharacterized protein n=1 Tax=Sulfitobacter porphyrae TaxID=1246864 RepID=A0ABW2B5M2_9RHOB|nr:hypothetical protein GCM10007928_02440 [Sulfitobacter porphyrae]